MNMKKFTDAYKECIIIDAIDPSYKCAKSRDIELITEQAKKIENKDNLLFESHGYAVLSMDKEVVAEESWPLFEVLYEYIGGYKSYKSVKDLVDTCEFIKFVYNGPLENIKDFKIENCLALATYNKKAGIKMTSIAVNLVCFPKQFTSAAARKLQRESLKFSWCEVSGKAEDFLINKCGAMQYLIDPATVKKVYPNILLDVEDKTHYSRILTDTGDIVRKIAFGTIKA